MLVVLGIPIESYYLLWGFIVLAALVSFGYALITTASRRKSIVTSEEWYRRHPRVEE